MIEEVVPVEVVRRFRHLAARHLGLDLHKSLEPMIGARIRKRLGQLQLSLHSYVTRMQQDTAGEEFVAFWDFVRPRPARLFARWSDCRRLSTRIGAALDDGNRRFRFWSAGCGTGEEAYTIALIAEHAIEKAGIDPHAVDLKILATDMSPRALEMGRRGVFAAPQTWDVPKAMRQQHFVHTTHGYQISDEIYNRVVFRQLALGAPPFPMSSKLDGVFCEEGLRCLVPAARRRALAAVRELLTEDGFVHTGLDDESAQDSDSPSTSPSESPPPGSSGSQTAC